MTRRNGTLDWVSALLRWVALTLILACTPGVANAAPPESDDFESMLKNGQGTGCFQYFVNQFGDGVLISYCGKDTVVEITGSCNVSGLRVPYGGNDVTMLDCGSMPSGTIRWCAADDYECDFNAKSASAGGTEADKPTEDSFPDFSSPAQGTAGELPDSYPEFDGGPAAEPTVQQQPAITPEPQQAEICDNEYCYPAGDPRLLPEGSREQLAALCMQEEKASRGNAISACSAALSNASLSSTNSIPVQPKRRSSACSKKRRPCRMRANRLPSTPTADGIRSVASGCIRR